MCVGIVRRGINFVLISMSLLGDKVNIYYIAVDAMICLCGEYYNDGVAVIVISYTIRGHNLLKGKL